MTIGSSAKAWRRFRFPSTRMTPKNRIDKIMTYKLEPNPYATVQKLAYSLSVSLQTVATDLREGLSIKYFHLRWVSHLLTSS
jgi:Fic family protein